MFPFSGAGIESLMIAGCPRMIGVPSPANRRASTVEKYPASGSKLLHVTTNRPAASTSTAGSRWRPAVAVLTRNAGPAGSLDFIGLLVSLGAQASALLGLGEAPDAEEKVRVDLPGARGIIGLLEILDRKTEGRRTPEEDQVLAGLLYQLRMAYLARAR